MDLWLLRPLFFERGSDMPKPDVPADSLDALLTAADDQATAEARSDGLAVVRFWQCLADSDIPEDLAGDLTRTWLESYLDGTPCSPDCD